MPARFAFSRLRRQDQSIRADLLRRWGTSRLEDVAHPLPGPTGRVVSHRNEKIHEEREPLTDDAVREIADWPSPERRRASSCTCLRLWRAEHEAQGFRLGSFLRLAFLFLTFVAPLASGWTEAPSSAEDELGRSRGVRLLDPGDTMMPIAPYPEVTPGFLARMPGSLEKVRVAVVDAQAAELAGLAPRAADFEVVPVTATPDLVWNARSGEARAGGQVIAYAVDRKSLPAVIDRTAAARGLEKEAAARPQAIKLVSGRATARDGDQVEIEVGDVAQRALILFGIAGDGTVEILYPRGGDERVVRARTFRWPLRIHAPFGVDLIVAVSAPLPMHALEQGLHQISHHRSAGEILKLLSIAAPPDARIGVLALATAP
jgi:hypothetical protein